ncbi:chloramphenicol phosphotransferase CPT family protein [Dongia rigui]|uniref:Chloramphenicol phosphotransferase n=1 Tax=Dongia rigui TaxID=940149 RepID=A0ABU5E090_9PROT|nr:chloramphenicol phosphotransferase [Dongia rigui]MDY0872600.1 chloramphenicol phosphotransferase [Dongia rigui]
MAARIVILNGVGSVGKTSIAKALQEITATPFLHVSMDVFCEMLPPAYFDHPDGMRFITEIADGKPSVAIHSGPVMARLMDGMRHAIAALAKSGNDLIVDDVMLGDTVDAYRKVLAPYRVHWVGVMASLAVLEAREQARGDRLIGLARWQFDRVHAGQRYDLEIDTNDITPAAAAALIKARFQL